MNFKPLYDNVLIKRVEAVKQTKYGLYIPDSAKEKPLEGNIIAMGSGRITDGKVVALSVKVGDNVLFGKYAGTELKLDGIEYLLMKESDILGILN